MKRRHLNDRRIRVLLHAAGDFQSSLTPDDIVVGAINSLDEWRRWMSDLEAGMEALEAILDRNAELREKRANRAERHAENIRAGLAAARASTS